MSPDRSGAWPGALAWGSLRREGTSEATQARGPACPDPQAQALLSHGSPELAAQGVLGVTQGLPGLCRVENQCPQTTAPAHQPSEM